MGSRGDPGEHGDPGHPWEDKHCLQGDAQPKEKREPLLAPGSELIIITVIVVQSLNHVRLLATPQTAARQASLSFTISLSLLKLKSIESVMPSNQLFPYHPLLLL